MATASIITGFVATFCFHKCQTRDYIRILANSQIFLDGIAGSVWIVLFLSSFDYLQLAMTCFMPCDFAHVR